LGIPFLEMLVEEANRGTAVMYGIIFNVIFNIFLWTVGIYLITQDKSAINVKKAFLNRFTLTTVVGMILYLTQIHLPGPVNDVINSLGACASPLGMLLCGMSLGKYPIRRLLRPGYLWFPLVRNLLIPALFLGLSLLIGLEKELAQVVIMFAALPVASLLAAFMIQYDPDKEAQFEAAAAVLLSTIFAAVTIPLWSSMVAVCFP
jgi:predicted permease